MTSKLLTVSLAPHTKGHYSIPSLMWGVVIALIPASIISLYVFGLGALKVICVSVLSCLAIEYCIQKFIFKRKPTISDGSAAVTGILLAFNLPSNLSWWIILIGAIVSIGIAKMTFGGLGNNPFNPALIGRVFLLMSFPAQMTSWPKPFIARWELDGITAATPLSIVKEGIKNGETFPDLIHQVPSHWELFLGKTGGCIGEISAFALLLGFIYLLHRKIITWHIPTTVVGTIFIFSGIFWLINPEKFADPLFHILSGGVMLGAIYMATDYVTSPMEKKGMLIFGVGIGLLTVIIRLFGAYPEGVSFGILIMNAFVPLINRVCKPRRFGE